MPIRWRLTFWFSLILAAILSLSGIVLYNRLQSYLNSQVDDNLEVYSARVHGTLNLLQMAQPLDYEVIHSKLPPVNGFASPGIYIQLIDHSGSILVKSDNLGKQELPVNQSLIDKGFAGNVAVNTVEAGGGAKVRMMVSPLYLQDKDKVVVVEVAQSLNHVDDTMSQVKLALVGSIILALVLAAVSGGFIARRALAPVSKVTQAARRIEGDSMLDRRVDYVGPKDEIGELATTFDHMIEHLDKVFQSQKQFVADASHELRGPLTVVKGNLDLLKRDLSGEDRRESLRAMEAETNRMTRIVADLLLLAEVESGQPEHSQVISLRETVRNELSRALPLAQNRSILLGKVEDLSVSGDTHMLKQLLGNLVDNAIRYTPDGGVITLSLFRESDYACLDVADTGVGIASEHLPHIFDRFYRVDKARSRASGGTGLGLAIVKGIAEQHGGTVTVTSEPGKGSTFTVWLKL